MNISASQNMQMALGAVWTHRFRSLLTILGIVIGITTVVTVASLLTGLRQGVVTFFQELGPDNIFLFRTSGDPSQDNRIPKEAKRRPLKPEYAETIKRWCPSVEDTGMDLMIPPVVEGKPITVRVPGYESDTINVAGRSPNMVDLTPRDFEFGRFFTSEEDQRAAHVVMLGSSVAAARAQGFADSDLASPFRDADQHDVHHTDAAHQQAESGNRDGHQSDEPGDPVELLDDLVGCGDREVVGPPVGRWRNRRITPSTSSNAS